MTRAAGEQDLVFTTDQWALMKLDLELNAQGLAWAAVKARERAL
jgi:hypothetical protein